MLGYTRERRRVYLVRQGEAYKIGSAYRPTDRLEQVCPDGDGELVHQILSRDAFAVENALHRRFAALRIEARGREWFSLSAEDVRAILELDRVDSVSDLPDLLSPPPSTPRHRYIMVKVVTPLHARIQRQAHRLGLSLSAYLRQAAVRQLEQDEASDPDLASED